MAIETLLQDLRYAWRHIQRSPGFALAAIVTLALGIGANTAMFSMLHALTMQRRDHAHSVPDRQVQRADGISSRNGLGK